MPLLSDELSLWELGFRWAELDPPALTSFLPIPLLVRDHLRNLMQAILAGELDCLTLSLDKWSPDASSDPEFFIRHYIDQVYACTSGCRFNRRLLRWAIIQRDDLGEWCDRRSIPKPAFWFPEGWKPFPTEFAAELQGRLKYIRHVGSQWLEEQDDEKRETLDAELQRAQTDYEAFKASGGESSSLEPKARAVQRVTITCQQIASALWKADPTISVPDMARKDEIRRLGGAAPYSEEVIRDWVAAVAPETVSRKAGRPPKKPRAMK